MASSSSSGSSSSSSHSMDTEDKSVARNHYLSYEYQEAGVNRLFNWIIKDLAAYTESKEFKKPSFIDPNKIKTKQELAQYIIDEIELLKNDFIASIKRDKAKPSHLRVGENNSKLIIFLKTVAAKIEEGIHLLENTIPDKRKTSGIKSIFKSTESIDKKRLLSIFAQLQKEIGNQIKYIEKAIEPKIYQVRMPKAAYEKMKKGSGTFHYEGRGTAIGKSVGGGVGVAVSVTATVLLFVPALVADVTVTEGHLLRGLGEIVIASGKVASEGITRYGRHCKMDIPPEFIRGEVLFTPEGKIALAQANPEYKTSGESKTEAKDEVIFYIVDGKAPTEVFHHGTKYHLDQEGVENPGHVIFFENPDDAALFTAQHLTDNFYEPEAGWRLYRSWTEEERSAFRTSLALAEGKPIQSEAKTPIKPTTEPPPAPPSSGPKP